MRGEGRQEIDKKHGSLEEICPNQLKNGIITEEMEELRIT